MRLICIALQVAFGLPDINIDLFFFLPCCRFSVFSRQMFQIPDFASAPALQSEYFSKSL